MKGREVKRCNRDTDLRDARVCMALRINHKSDCEALDGCDDAETVSEHKLKINVRTVRQRENQQAQKS